jgi:uncharacterized protein involved in outer membrane biogenesis
MLLAGMLAVYAALGFLAVPRLVASLARDMVRADYGRDLAIGAVRFNPFTLTFEVDRLALPDADGGPLLGFDSLIVDLDVNSLWRRAWSFGAIRVDGLAVQAVVRTGGALNLADLETPAAPGAAPPADEPLPRLIIGDLAVTNGRVRFEDRDRPEPYVASLAPLTFRLTEFSTYAADGDHYELDATLFDSSRFAWRGTLQAQPLASEGEFTLSDLPLPRLAGFLGDALRLEITSGAASLRGRYRFANRAAGADVVVDSGELFISKLAIRDRGEETDYLDLERVTVTGLQLSLAEQKAEIGVITLDGGSIQTWLTPEGELKRSGIFDPLVAPTEETAGRGSAPATADKGWQVRIPRIQVQGLGFRLEDRALDPAPALVLKPLNVTIDGYSTAPGTSVQLALDATVNDHGRLTVAGTTNLDTLATEADVELRGLELALAQPYIARQTSLTVTGGELTAKGRITWADATPAQLGFTGDASIDGFATTDNVLRKDFVKWAALGLSGIDYRSSPESLRIAGIDARSPYARVIIGPDGTTNIAAILAGPGATATAVPGPTVGPAGSRTGGAVAVTSAGPATAGAPPASEAAPFPIRIGTLKVSDGSANFSDLTTRPSFAIGIEKLRGTIVGLSSAPASRATVDLDGQVDRFSPVTIRGRVNPLAAETFLDMAMTFRNVELASFTPYSGRFAGYAIRQGKLSVDLDYKVNDRKLDAKHKFVINQLELGDKVESPDAVGLPLKLAVALLKDRNGVIDLDLPVTGDLDDPQFRVGPIIWKVLVNLLSKAVTAPFALLGRLFGGGEEINLIAFAAGDPLLDAAAREKVGTLVKALNERPGLRLTVPASFNRTIDEPALREEGLQARLVAARQAELAGKKQPADGVTFASVTADPGAYQRLLTSVYRLEYGKDAPLPELPPEAADPAARIPLLEESLRQRVAVTDTEFFDLAKARAEGVQALLLTDTGVDPGRVFLTSPVEGKAAEAGVVMELALE